MISRMRPGRVIVTLPDGKVTVWSVGQLDAEYAMELMQETLGEPTE